MTAVAVRIIRQMLGDRRTLALIMLVPLMLLLFLYLLLGKTAYEPKIDVSGIPAPVVQQMRDAGASVADVTQSQGREDVRSGAVDALLYRDGTKTKVLLLMNDAVKSGVVLKKVQEAFRAVVPGGAIGTEYVFGSADDSMFDSLGYVLLGILSFFLVFIVAGVSFVRERTGNTMERLLLSPVRRWQVVFGYTLGFGFFTVIQCVLMLTFAIWVLGLPIRGGIVGAGAVMVLLSLAAVSMGAFASIFSNNEFQMLQFIPVAVIPQIFFSGLISLDTMPFHLGLLAKIMPVYYACDGLKRVLIRGQGIADFWPDLAALFAFLAVFTFMNIMALKKYRKI